MKNEGLFLVAFILLAIILLAMVVYSEKETFTGNVVVDLQQLEERVTNVETTLQNQNNEMNRANDKVSDAAISLNAIT